jgi:hypothetical protein
MSEYLDKSGKFDNHKWLRVNQHGAEPLTEDVQSKMVKTIK